MALSALHPTFEAIILKSMAKDPNHRYATSEDLRADLLRFNEGRSVLAMEDPTAMQAALGVTQAVGAVGAVGGINATQAISAQARPGVGTVPGDEGEETRERNRTRTYAIVLGSEEHTSEL